MQVLIQSIELFNCLHMLDFRHERRRVFRQTLGRDTSNIFYLICVRGCESNIDCLCAKLYVASFTVYRLNNFFLWLSNTNPTVGQSLQTTNCSYVVNTMAQYQHLET
jgi:hypothetical protein